MQGKVPADRKVRKGRGSCPQGPADFSDTGKVKGRVSLVVGGRSFLFFTTLDPRSYTYPRFS